MTVFEKQVAYAEVAMAEDGKSLLSFLSDCDWKNLPSLILLNMSLSDMTAPNLLRELLLNTRYMQIPKLIWVPGWDAKEMSECRMLGIKHFLKRADSVFEIENNVHVIDNLLKAELSLL